MKVGGLIIDRREVLHGKVDQMSREEVEKRLAHLIGSRVLSDQQSGSVIEAKIETENKTPDAKSKD
jgi:hypothetical protein